MPIPTVNSKIVDGQYILDIPDLEEKYLPKVSLLTITKNRKHLMPIAIHCWKNYQYPRDKLEWVIVDDSDKENRCLDLLPKDSRIRYFIKKPDDFKTLGQKRNFGVSRCSHDYIVIIDDDDYYFPDSIIAKIKTLLYYKKQCVFSMPIGIYNTITKKSHIANVKEKVCIQEANIAFTKTFWKKNKFGRVNYAEGENLIKKQHFRMIHLPFWFNCISITHKENHTGNLRNIEDENNVEKGGNDLSDMFDETFKDILINI
jgi:glycosyltransferase involved in cell wall biosynthesis